jgi:hypothetical protein
MSVLIFEVNEHAKKKIAQEILLLLQLTLSPMFKDGLGNMRECVKCPITLKKIV